MRKVQRESARVNAVMLLFSACGAAVFAMGAGVTQLGVGRALIGMGSGESVQLAMSGEGWVLVQPSEGRQVVAAR